MNKTRIVSLLLVLAILVSCVPVFSVSAASSMTLSGWWRITSGWTQAYDDAYFSDFSIDASFYVYVDGSLASCSSLFFDGRYDSSVLFVDSSSLGGMYDLFSDDGYHAADGGYLYFTSPVSITDSSAIEFFSVYAVQETPSTFALFIDGHEEHSHIEPWTSQNIVDESGTTFECDLCSWELIFTPSGTGTFSGFEDASGNTYWGQCRFDVDVSELSLTSIYTIVIDPDPDPGTTYTSTITIDGEVFSFTGTIEQPTVLLEVNSGGAVMTYGDQAGYYVYPSSDTFLGLGVSPSGDAVFLPGNSYSLAAGDHVFYAIGSDDVSSSVSVSIDDQTFSFAAEEFPVYITVAVTKTGCQLSNGDTVLTYTYSGEGVFSGLTFEFGSDPVFFVGDETTIEFSDAENSTYILYSCCDEEGKGLSGIWELLKKLYESYIKNSFSIPGIAGLLGGIDFTPFITIFRTAYEGLTSLFGLQDLLEDSNGPFAWLLE